MAYNRGTNTNIIVGAAALFATDNGPIDPNTLPQTHANVSYKTTLSQAGSGYTNVGYTSNGIELQFQPDFGEVKVDQLLDVAKLYKQGMQVNLKTTFVESTLENLLLATAGKVTDGVIAGDLDVATTGPFVGDNVLNLNAGQIGECPIERGLIAVGPGTGDCELGSSLERIYVAYRALSIESVTVSAKRDEATQFEVSFRLLPNDAAGSYGKIVDRTIATSI